jgi:hypothetical protein
MGKEARGSLLARGLLYGMLMEWVGAHIAAAQARFALIRFEPIPGRLAQLGERRLDKAEVTGSSPVSPITKMPC